MLKLSARPQSVSAPEQPSEAHSSGECMGHGSQELFAMIRFGRGALHLSAKGVATTARSVADFKRFDGSGATRHHLCQDMRSAGCELDVLQLTEEGEYGASLVRSGSGAQVPASSESSGTAARSSSRRGLSSKIFAGRPKPSATQKTPTEERPRSVAEYRRGSQSSATTHTAKSGGTAAPAPAVPRLRAVSCGYETTRVLRRYKPGALVLPSRLARNLLSNVTTNYGQLGNVRLCSPAESLSPSWLQLSSQLAKHGAVQLAARASVSAALTTTVAISDEVDRTLTKHQGAEASVELTEHLKVVHDHMVGDGGMAMPAGLVGALLEMFHAEYSTAGGFEMNENDACV